MALPLARLARSPVLVSVGQITLGNAAIGVIQVIAGFLMARWVTPKEMGVWNAVNLVGVYAPFLTLGVFSGLAREVPYLMGQGKRDEASAMAGASWAWSWLLAGLSAPCLLGAVVWFLLRGQAPFAWACLAVGLSLLCGWWISHLNTTYRTLSEFGRLTWNSTWVAAVGLALMVLVWAWGFNGLLVRAMVVAALGVVALYYRRPMPVRPIWSPRDFVRLVKVGLPIFLVGQLWMILTALDRTVLVSRIEDLGYFTLAIHAGTAARMVAAAFTVVVYPRMAQSFGQDNHAVPLWKMGLRASMATTAPSVVLGACGWLLLPPFVKWFLPSYVPGIAAAQWACLCGVAMGPYVFGNIFNVLKRQDLALIGWAIGMVSFWGLWTVLTGQLGVAATTAAAMAMVLGTFAATAVNAGVSWWACRAHDRSCEVAA